MFHASGPLFVGMSLVVCAPLLSAAPLPRPSPEKVRKELDVLWADLLSPDELTAGSALLKCATRPEDTVDYLKDKLSPLNLSKKRAKRLLAELAGDDVKAVRAAFAELMYFDPRLALGIEELCDALCDPHVSRRLGEVLCDLPLGAFWRRQWHFHSPDNKVYRFNHGEEIQNRDIAIAVAGIGTHGRKLSWVRAVRAVALLEQIATRGAVKILEDLATGHPEAAPTKAAKVALERLRKK